MLMSPPVVSLQSLENECEFIPRHIGPDAQEQQTMLAAIGKPTLDALIRDGVPRTIISADGRGDANPIASNTTAEGRAQNRRIEVTLAGPGN